MSLPDPLDRVIESLAPRMRGLLSESLRIPSISGNEAEFVRYIRDFASAAGFTCDMWETDEADLAKFPVAQTKHLPLLGRPTLVIGLPDPGPGRSLMFNAHSDVVSIGRPESWTFGPWSGTEIDGRFHGRGACDVKGPLVSALWGMMSLKQTFPNGPPGKIQLELIPGEEDCVTLGTLTSVIRGYQTDGCIVLEPTECLPRNASRPGLRFDITCRGKAVHGTVKWLGEDAIVLAHAVTSILKILEDRWNDGSADPMFAGYPIARPLTVDSIHGGRWQGMICDECQVAGYLELLPNDEPGDWMQRLSTQLKGLLDEQGFDGRRINVRFPECYPGHHTVTENSLCKTAESVLDVSAGLAKNDCLRFVGWAGFNSGCEAGLRANLHHTPTLVWGPGSLEQAHSADEFIEFGQVQAVANLFARFAAVWTSQ